MTIKITVEEIDKENVCKQRSEVTLSPRAERYLTGCRAYNPEEPSLGVWINEIIENSD